MSWKQLKYAKREMNTGSWEVKAGKEKLNLYLNTFSKLVKSTKTKLFIIKVRLSIMRKVREKRKSKMTLRFLAFGG